MTLHTAVPTREGAVARSVALSASSQVAARAFDVCVNVVVSLAVIRYLGPTSYGDYVLVITVAGLFGLFSDFGLPKLGIRETARDVTQADDVIGTIIAMRLGLAVVCATLAQLALLAIGASAEVHVATAVAGGLYVTEALMSVAIEFHATLRQQYEAVVRLASNIVKLTLVVALIASGAGIVLLVGAPVVAGVVAATLAFVIARRRFDLRLRFDRTRVAPLARGALVVGPAMIIGIAYLKLDALMVGLLLSRHDLGIYGAAYLPIEYVFFTVAIPIGVLFPLVSRSFGSDPARFVSVYRGGVETVVAALLPLGIGLCFVGEPLIKAIYQPRFAGAAGPMAVLGFAVVFMAVNGWQSFVLLAGDRAGVNLTFLGTAVGLNIVIDLALIPTLGRMGAAWGTLATAIFLATCTTWAIAHYLDARPSVPRLARVLGAAAMLIAVFSALSAAGFPWLAVGALAALSYPVLLQIAGVFDLRSVLARLRDHDEIDLTGDDAMIEFAEPMTMPSVEAP